MFLLWMNFQREPETPIDNLPEQFRKIFNMSKRKSLKLIYLCIFKIFSYQNQQLYSV